MNHLNITDELIKRFWSKVDIKSEDECWTWKDSTVPRGYGHISIESRPYYAHRISYCISYGDIPDGLLICHKCNNRSCVNPKHLYAGTSKDNIRDSINAGTFSEFPHFRGDNSPTSKLTSIQVLQIRDLIDAGVRHKDIAKQFNIGRSTVTGIHNKLIWKHLE